jgi:membrane-associated phospholipid phosphatase
MTLIVWLTMLIDAAGPRDVHLEPHRWSGQILAIFALFCAGARLYRRDRRLADVCVACGWGLTAAVVSTPVVYAAARSPVGMQDALLAHTDGVLGLPVPTVLGVLRSPPMATRAWEIAYDLLYPLMLAALVLPPLCGRPNRTRRILAAAAVSFLLVVPLFATFQAMGPWAFHGFAPNPQQAVYVSVMRTLKAPGPVEIEPSGLTGLITFPSFHTVLALFSAHALTPVRGVGWVAPLVAAAVILSTVATGWHYVSDVLGGMALASMSLLIVRAGERALDAIRR